MTIESLLAHTGEELAAMTDEQLLELLKEALAMEPMPHLEPLVAGAAPAKKAKAKKTSVNAVLEAIKAGLDNPDAELEALLGAAPTKTLADATVKITKQEQFFN